MQSVQVTATCFQGHMDSARVALLTVEIYKAEQR